MKCLSIRQPWAWAIIHAGKDVENRTWTTKYRGPLLIHAGKQWDPVGLEFLVHRFGHNPVTVRKHCEIGGIIGSITLTDVTEQPIDSLWWFGPVAWCLSDPKPAPFVEVPGRLGLFNVEPDWYRSRVDRA